MGNGKWEERVALLVATEGCTWETDRTGAHSPPTTRSEIPHGNNDENSMSIVHQFREISLGVGPFTLLVPVEH